VHGYFPDFSGGRDHTISFSDYAVVIQAALLGQGIALGWLTVISNALLSRTLVPAVLTLTRTSRRCVLVSPRDRPTRPIVKDIRAWIIAQLRSDVEAIERSYPGLGLLAAGY
jgi:DNA-binding transcriptional LysR family regulator